MYLFPPPHPPIAFLSFITNSILQKTTHTHTHTLSFHSSRMELTQSLNMGWSTYNYNQAIPKEEYDDVFSFPYLLPPLDLR